MGSTDEPGAALRLAHAATVARGGGETCLRRGLAVASFVVLAAICVGTFRDYGATWDEEFHESYAAQLDAWYRTGGRDDRAVRTDLVHDYGGLFEIVNLRLGWLPFGQYEDRHLVNLSFGLLGIAFAYRLAHLLGGARAGLLAAAFVTLTPVYYGHMFANPKDVPFAALYLVALDAICRVQRGFPDVSWWRVVGGGAAIGGCLGVRVGGIVLFGILGLAVAMAEWPRLRQATAAGARRWAVAWRSASRLLIVAPLIAWGVMCYFWPYAWVSPINHPLATLQAFSRYPWGGEVLFRGQLTPARHAPWDYLPTWLAVSLPDFLLVAAVIGAAGWALRALRRPAAVAPSPVALVLVAGLAPLIMPVVMGSTLYDGLRHVLFCLPPLIVVVAVLYTDLLARVRTGLAAVALALPIASGMLVTLVDMVQLHPYQYVYFNRLFGGGLASAHARFDTDYWCASIKEAVDWTVTNVPAAPSGPLRVASGCPLFLTEYYLARAPRAAGRFVGVTEDERRDGGADLYLTVTRERKHEKVRGTVLHRVERQGAPLCYVIDLRR